MSRELRIYKITDAGPKDNQDSCYVVQHGTFAALACMADGVSSQSGARKTAAFITDYVQDWYEEEGDRIFSSQPEDVKEYMLELVMDIHNDLLVEGESENMGSTMDLAVIGHRKMFITHVGDSRVYIYDGKNLKKITEDQTVSEAEKITGIRFDQIDERRKPHMLMQCMGHGAVSPYQYEEDIPMTCDILLCSDGFTNRLTDHDLATEFRKKQAGSDALLNLVKLARERGEPDNITAILIRRRERADNVRKNSINR